MSGRSRWRLLCAAAAVLCCVHARDALAQPPAPTTLEQATDPLRYAPDAPPADPCLYWPCSRPQLILNRLTGSLLPKRTWTAGDRVRLAVVNLNPFLHRSQVTVEVKPLDPGAPGDFMLPPLEETALSPAMLSEDAGMAMFPCEITDAQRQRLRLTYGRVREARLRMGVWLQDSLAGPRDAVGRRTAELAGVLFDARAPARDLFAAAWRYRALAEVYAPAVIRSGLVDSTRIVPLALVSDGFATEVAELGSCFDDELVTWKTEIALTTDLLARARSYVSSTLAFAEELLSRARTYWATAARPQSFYILRDIGGYDAPMNVFVKLYLFDRDAPPTSALAETQASFGWTLIFRE